MPDSVNVRDARDEDVRALTDLDLRYDASRVLALARRESDRGYTFAFRWIDRAPSTALYAAYDAPRLHAALGRADLFLVAEASAGPVGLLIANIPAWTDAGEITDLAVDLSAREHGAGRALVEAALEFARSRRLRALWVEPRSNNSAAIEFYRALGFRLSGFNDRMYSNADDSPGSTTLFMHREL